MSPPTVTRGSGAKLGRAGSQPQFHFVNRKLLYFKSLDGHVRHVCRGTGERSGAALLGEAARCEIAREHRRKELPEFAPQHFWRHPPHVERKEPLGWNIAGNPRGVHHVSDLDVLLCLREGEGGQQGWVSESGTVVARRDPAHAVNCDCCTKRKARWDNPPRPKKEGKITKKE